jgi:hypothetical protein
MVGSAIATIRLMIARLKKSLYRKDKKLNECFAFLGILSFQLVRLRFILKCEITLKCFKRKKIGNIRNKSKNSIRKKTIMVTMF